MSYQRAAPTTDVTPVTNKQPVIEQESIGQRQTAVSNPTAVSGNPRPPNNLHQQVNGNLARAGSVLLQLQNQFGNRYVQQLINPQQQLTVQPKLMLGDIDTPSEREADQIAAQMTGSGQVTSTPTAVTGPTLPVSPETESAINQAKGGGQPLPQSTRSPMEQSLGTDLSSVRVHTDSRADSLNQSLQAQAFTTGQDIFFRQGGYNPGSSNGQNLLAHELTHVAQQNQGNHAIQRKIYASAKIGLGKKEILPKAAHEHLLSLDIPNRIASALAKWYGHLNMDDIALGDMVKIAKEAAAREASSQKAAAHEPSNQQGAQQNNPPAPPPQPVQQNNPPAPPPQPVQQGNAPAPQPAAQNNAPAVQAAPQQSLVDMMREILTLASDAAEDIGYLDSQTVSGKALEGYLKLYKSGSYYEIQNSEIPDYFKAIYQKVQDPQYQNMTVKKLLRLNPYVLDENLVPDHWASGFDPQRLWAGDGLPGHLTPVFYPENIPQKKGGQVYRGDKRPPWDNSIIAPRGLTSWSVSRGENKYSRDFLRHIVPQISPDDSFYISTSFNRLIDQRFDGYKYFAEVKSGGIEVDKYFVTDFSQSNDERELTVPQRIPFEKILTVSKGRRTVPPEIFREILKNNDWDQDVKNLWPTWLGSDRSTLSYSLREKTPFSWKQYLDGALPLDRELYEAYKSEEKVQKAFDEFYSKGYAELSAKLAKEQNRNASVQEIMQDHETMQQVREWLIQNPNAKKGKKGIAITKILSSAGYQIKGFMLLKEMKEY